MTQKGQSMYPKLNDNSWLYQKYAIEELSMLQIARILGCHRDTVSRTLKHQNIPKRKVDTKGENNPNWKGGKIKKVCTECGGAFFVKRYNEKANFCSIRCYAKWQSKNKGGKNHSAWKGGKIKRVCQYCSKEFYVKQSAPKSGRGKYCSKICSRKAQHIPKHHTLPERIFSDICKKNNVETEYTGDSKIWIGRINPDFVYYNSRKKYAIFINGNYWHDPLHRQNIRRTQRPDYQIETCKKHRWVPLLIWESDLKREDAEAFVLATLKKEGVI